ncbi:MAG TPA: DUF3800 domain-containing protein [Alphaproteobacteria bacterium]|nr:DUF3800 domain-containing protein [Alphaproteobacteria bacterium]
MHLVYIDDSKDDKYLCFSALCIPAKFWQAALTHLVDMRRQMKACDGIYTSIELHATDWIGGRGNVAPFPVYKGTRARLFDFALSCYTRLPGVQLFNAFGMRADEDVLFERLLNRIHVNMTKAGSQAFIICDEGKTYDRILRKQRRHNYIPSRFGDWGGGQEAKNIPVHTVIEDINYRRSDRSYFVQAADFCAFSLLRHESPTAATIKYRLHRSFWILEPIMVKQAYANDPLKAGVIRAK